MTKIYPGKLFPLKVILLELGVDFFDWASKKLKEMKIPTSRKGMKIDTPEYRELVRLEEPHGDLCGKCMKKNDFWDDCGWFMCYPYHYGAVCKSCWDELGCTTGER